MIYLLYVIHVLVCLFLILVVLLQQGKGADLSVFGGGSTQTAFGARGATTLLHKLTVGSFIVFIVTTLLIGLPQIHRSGGTVMEGAETEEAAPTKPAAATTPTPAPAKPPTPAERQPAPSER